MHACAVIIYTGRPRGFSNIDHHHHRQQHQKKNKKIGLRARLKLDCKIMHTMRWIGCRWMSVIHVRQRKKRLGSLLVFFLVHMRLVFSFIHSFRLLLILTLYSHALHPVRRQPPFLFLIFLTNVKSYIVFVFVLLTSLMKIKIYKIIFQKKINNHRLLKKKLLSPPNG